MVKSVIKLSHIFGHRICIHTNITLSQMSDTVPVISTMSSGEKVFVACQFEFSLGT